MAAKHFGGLPDRANSLISNLSFGFLLSRNLESDVDPSCPKCTSRRCRDLTKYRDWNDCNCRPCPIGQKPTLKGDKCEVKSDRHGQCPPSYALDPAAGGQDKTTPNPSCLPDDADQCDPGQVPQSREKTDREPKFATCVKDIDEKDKPACQSSEYRHVDVFEVDGVSTAKYSCRKTRKFSQNKDAKFEESRLRKKAEYDENQRKEEERRKKEEEEKNRIANEEEEKKRIEQDEADKKRIEAEEGSKNQKKTRMGKCLTIVPLCFSVGATGFEYSNLFFDEGFAAGEELMQYWPPDLATVPDTNIDSEEYLSKFMDAVSSSAWIMHRIGPGKRSIEPILEPSHLVSISGSATDVTISNHQHEKRYVPAVVAAIATFLRILGPVITRVGASSAKLKKLVEKGGVKLAEAGKSTRSLDEMRRAAKNISENRNWKNCIEGKNPVSG